MSYTVERVHSCVGESRQAVFRLIYEITYIPELGLWRYFLVSRQEIDAVTDKMETSPLSVMTPDLGPEPAPPQTWAA